MQSYAEGLRMMKKKQLETLMKDIPAGKQEEYRRQYETEIAAAGKPATPVPDSLIYTLLKDTLKIGGYRTEKYLVMLGGRKLEETWVAPSLNVTTQLDWKVFLSCLAALEPTNPLMKYMLTDSYIALLKKGYPVRRIIVQGGYRSEIQVNKIEEKNIPAFEFYTPDLCKQVSIEKWVSRKSAAEPAYDDYE
jgi:hypothetical protein